jgi:SNF2 family DNA or RNA helicase
MRIARYMGNRKVFEENYHIIISSPSFSHTQDTFCDYWMPPRFNLEQVEAFPPSIRAFLINQKLIVQLFNLSPFNEYFDYALNNLSKLKGEDQAELIKAIFLLLILKGDWEQFNKTRNQVSIDPMDLNRLLSIRQFISGKNDMALASFDANLKILRSEKRNNKIQFTGLTGFFHFLAKLKTQNEAILKKANTQIIWSQKNEGTFALVHDWFKAVLHYLKNEKALALNLLSSANTEFYLLIFIRLLCVFWVDRNKLILSEVETFYKKMKSYGYRWLESELLAIWNQLDPTNKQVEKELQELQNKLGSESLVHIVPHVEDWELALKALKDLGINASPEKQSESRLIWLVDFQFGRIQAKEQTFGKKGWTKGRAISFSRLLNGEINNLTTQDQSIIATVGYASGSEIPVYKTEIWEKMVGHPLLFLRKSPTIAVQLNEEKPRLIAKKEGNGFRLSFSHPINKTGVQILKETPTRYTLLNIPNKIADIANAFNGKTLKVPEKGTDALKEVIAGLSNIVQVESVFEDENLPTVKADARPCVHLLPIGDGFHLEVYAKPFKEIPPYVKIGQGETVLITTVEGIRTSTKRNLSQEKANLKTLKEAVPILKEIRPKQGVWQLEDSEQCLELLLQLAPLIEDKSILLEWPKGEKFRISQIVGMDQFRLEINQKNNWFELQGQLPIDEEKVLTMQELLALSEKKTQFIELSQGKFLALTKEFRRRLEEINSLVSAQKNGNLQLHPLAAPAIQGFTDSIKNLKADPKFKENQERLKKAFAKKFRVSKKFKATLRPYQQEGFQWLHRCAAWGVGACLADDMGLGKTIQALALLTDRAKLGPALVVAPASVCRNWMAETKKFAPSLNPILFGLGDRKAMIKKAKKGDLIVVTYDLMTREGPSFIEKSFATLILDEAQAIKNKSTKRSEVAMSLQADFKIIMTGTPVENHLGELWNLFQFVNPGLLGSIDSFTKRFAIPIEKNKDQNKREQLRKLLQPFILRRKKGEVLNDLPEKTEITLTATLSPEERAFYEALRRKAIEKLETDESGGGQKHLKILAEIMKLRRAACHPILADKNADFIESAKLQLFGSIIHELLASGHKALVFSQFVGHLKLLETHLQKQNISYQYLDGSTPLAKRQDRIDAFQKGEGDIFLISLKAGGTGLNLTAADYVIHMDPWWNPAVEDQATDRAHRIGQERPVTVYRLVTEGTIEEKILQLHEKKRDLADSLLTGTDVSAKLTAKDLMNLIAEVH